MSQKDLARHVGYSYQQVQKYEKGLNRVSASVLYEFGHALNVDVSFFFQGLVNKPSHAGRLQEERAPSAFAVDPMRKSDVIKLVREYERITDTHVRRKLLEAVRATADALSHEAP
jgi:transcriptional regulator with XRE-family HTH domain